MSTMFPWKSWSSGLLVPLAAALAACGGDWNDYDPSGSPLPEDTTNALSYPPGPYPTRVGEVIEDLSFPQAFYDPFTFCKSAKNLDMTQSPGVQGLSMGQLYRGDPLCATKKKQLVWVVATAGW